MAAGDKFVGRDVAGRRFGLADVFNPMFDAQPAAGQFDQSADVVVECGDRADQDFFVDQVSEQEAGERRRSADELAAIDQHPIALSAPRSQGAPRACGAIRSDCPGTSFT